MQRRDFLALTGLTAGGLLVPSFFGKAIAAEQLQTVLDPAWKVALPPAAALASTISIGVAARIVVPLRRVAALTQCQTRAGSRWR